MDHVGDCKLSAVPQGQGNVLYPVQLLHEQLAVTVLPTGTDLTNAIELSKWEITKPSAAADNALFIWISTLLAEVKRTAGAGNIRFGIHRSDDDVSWSVEQAAFGETASFAGISNFAFHRLPPITTRYLRFATYASNGTTAGEIQRILGQAYIVLPFGWTMKEVAI